MQPVYEIEQKLRLLYRNREVVSLPIELLLQQTLLLVYGRLNQQHNYSIINQFILYNLNTCFYSIITHTTLCLFYCPLYRLKWKNYIPETPPPNPSTPSPTFPTSAIHPFSSLTTTKKKSRKNLTVLSQSIIRPRIINQPFSQI